MIPSCDCCSQCIVKTIIRRNGTYSRSITCCAERPDDCASEAQVASVDRTASTSSISNTTCVTRGIFVPAISSHTPQCVFRSDVARARATIDRACTRTWTGTISLFFSKKSTPELDCTVKRENAARTRSAQGANGGCAPAEEESVARAPVNS